MTITHTFYLNKTGVTQGRWKVLMGTDRRVSSIAERPLLLTVSVRMMQLSPSTPCQERRALWNVVRKSVGSSWVGVRTMGSCAANVGVRWEVVGFKERTAKGCRLPTAIEWYYAGGQDVYKHSISSGTKRLSARNFEKRCGIEIAMIPVPRPAPCKCHKGLRPAQTN